MTDIVVRKVKFDFPDELDDVFPGDDIVGECYLAAFSLTMPMLEPYLIRTYRSMAHLIVHPELADDVQQFIGQEAQHHRNHSRVNAIIHARLGDDVAGQLQRIEDQLDADYRRFNAKKSARFNAVYAEGFEAMTCAMAITMFQKAAAGGNGPRFGAWQQLWAWHAAEEMEHRTVAFDVYERTFGGYVYRVYGSLRAQWHFGRRVARLQRVLLAANGETARWHMPSWWTKQGRANYFRTFRPSYDPAALDPGPLAAMVLSMYSPS
jgi:hypothetical protein